MFTMHLIYPKDADVGEYPQTSCCGARAVYWDRKTKRYVCYKGDGDSRMLILLCERCSRENASHRRKAPSDSTRSAADSGEKGKTT